MDKVLQDIRDIIIISCPFSHRKPLEEPFPMSFLPDFRLKRINSQDFLRCCKINGLFDVYYHHNYRNLVYDSKYFYTISSYRFKYYDRCLYWTTIPIHKYDTDIIYYEFWKLKQQFKHFTPKHKCYFINTRKFTCSCNGFINHKSCIHIRKYIHAYFFMKIMNSLGLNTDISIYYVNYLFPLEEIRTT